MDDKFLRDKINDDNIEIPESLLPENISKLLEKSEEKVNGLVESDMDGRAEGTNENIVDTKSINEKAVNESDKKNKRKETNDKISQKLCFGSGGTYRCPGRCIDDGAAA